VLGFQRFVIVENFMLTVSIIGGAALIAMGGILFLAARNMRLPDMKTEARFDKGLVFGGIFFSLISPGFLAWWATIGISTVVRALLFGIFGISVLALGHFIADVLWYWLLSYATVKGKQHLTRRSYQNAMRLFAVLLVFLGFRFLTNLSSPALR
jgi:threonine/homoserine/homoserine lactone efflux protein